MSSVIRRFYSLCVEMQDNLKKFVFLLTNMH